MVTVYYAGSPDVSVGVPELFAGTGLKNEDGFGLGFYPYQVHTGAGWSGPIGLSVIRFTLADDFSGLKVDGVTRNLANTGWMGAERTKNLLAHTKPWPNVFQWVYRDYEPTHAHDPQIAFATRWLDGNTAEPAASSHLKLGDYEYPAWMAVDRSPGTAWAESARGPGIGEWLELDLDQRTEVREIRVFPGHQKRSDLFRKYNRPSRLKVEFDDGTSAVVDLRDEMGMQTFPVQADARSAKVTIEDVYRGTNERDETYLSEITFATSPAPLFDTFETLTGIKPSPGHVEPAALAPRTRGAGAAEPGESGDGRPAGRSGGDGGDGAGSRSPGGAVGQALLISIAASALVAAGVLAGWAIACLRRPAEAPSEDGPQEPVS